MPRKLSSRERITAALEHRVPDRVPLDLGSTPVSGMQASSVYKLRQALKLDPPGTPVKVTEPYQMLGEIGEDLREVLGVDTVPVGAPSNLFGFKNEGWKRWDLFDGTPVLVPALFNTQPDALSGDIFQYPEGDTSVSPSGRMPKGGFYFDAIVRQPTINEATLSVDDNCEEFVLASDELLKHYRDEVLRLYESTDKAIVLTFPNLGFGDIALVPAMWLKQPKGIRDIQEWYMSTVSRTQHVRQIFERQCDVALRNLRELAEVVGDRASVLMITGTDFGMQTGPLISPRSYRSLYQPFHRKLNDFVHSNTNWRTFIHCCGSCRVFLSDFIAAGFDILNPVQCSAHRMDPSELKAEVGEKLVFWGGGVDTQQTLPFGTPADVAAEVRQRLWTLGVGGGMVFNPTHNVQAGIPVSNLLSMYNTLRDYGTYPLQAP